MNILKHTSDWFDTHKNDMLFVGMKRLRKTRRSMMGFYVVAFVTIMAIFAPLISPHDPNALSSNILSPPGTGTHLLGTDDFGRDTLSRLIWGAQASLYVGAISVSIATVIGTTLGMIAGYYRGVKDEIIMRFADGLLAFPSILLALLVIAVLGPTLFNMMIAIGIVFIPLFIRISRATTISIVERDHVVAAKAIGESDFGIILHEILPNSLAPIIVQATFNFSQAILVEAFLSFIGLGVQPPTATWGSMIDVGRSWLETSPWLALFPGIFISLTVLALNLLGDGLRDAFDPRLLDVT